jgi:tetratricopeptide (TPR) repeat protein
MSSQQNRDKSSIALRLAVAATLVFAAAQSQAADPVARPVLTGYSDSVSTDDLKSGEYKSMVAEVARFKEAQSVTPTAYNTNLCVGYITARQMDEAQKACDAAVRAAKRERTQLSSWMVSSRKAYNEQIAIAYANRAVMYYLANKPEQAAKDLTKAEALAPSAGYVTRNLAALSSGNTVAQATSVK